MVVIKEICYCWIDLFLWSVEGDGGKDTINLAALFKSSVKGGDGADVFSATGHFREFHYGNSANDTFSWWRLSKATILGVDDDSVTIGGNSTSVSIAGGTGADSIFAGGLTSPRFTRFAGSSVTGADSISLGQFPLLYLCQLWR